MTEKRAALPRGNGPRTRVRKPEILATTVDLVREQGLANVRVADVAARAGTSPAGVIYYFASKDQLFYQAVTDADAAFYARLRPEIERLESAVDRLACLVVRSSESEWPLWIDSWALARQTDEMREAEIGFEIAWCGILSETIAHGVARGEFTTEDPDAVAVRLSALSEGLAVHMVLGMPGRTVEHYVATVLRAAARELGCDPARFADAAARVPAADSTPLSDAAARVPAADFTPLPDAAARVPAADSTPLSDTTPRQGAA